MSAARVVAMALAAAGVTLVTHLVRPGQYSVLAYVGVIQGLIFVSTASWTSTSVVRYGREELERDGAIRATSWSRLIITLPLVAVASTIVVALKVIGALPRELTWIFVGLACVSALVAIAIEHVVNLLEACGRMKLTALGVTLQRGLLIAGLGGLVVLGVVGSPLAIAVVSLVAACVFVAGMAAAVWKIGMWPVRVDRTLFRRIVVFSLPMIGFSASQYVIGSIDIVILGAYRSAHDVGVYSIAYQGYGVLLNVATTATIVLSPLFVSLRAASQEHVITRYFERMVPQVLFLAAIGAGLVAPFIGLLVPPVFGADYRPVALPLTILLFSWLMYAADSFAAPILVLHERSRAIALMSVAAAVTNLVGDWLLVGVFGVGIAGPAIATTASIAVIALGYFRVAGKCIDRRQAVPVAMMIPGAAGIGLALAFHGIIAIGLSWGGTLLAAAAVFLWKRPFTAGDADLIDKLDIPGPFKRATLRVLARLD